MAIYEGLSGTQMAMKGLITNFFIKNTELDFVSLSVSTDVVVQNTQLGVVLLFAPINKTIGVGVAEKKEGTLTSKELDVIGLFFLAYFLAFGERLWSDFYDLEFKKSLADIARILPAHDNVEFALSSVTRPSLWYNTMQNLLAKANANLLAPTGPEED